MLKHGRARINPSSPSAPGICDRCGFYYQLSDLNWEVQWKGPQLSRTGYRVCCRCFDKPFIFFKPIILPPDPLPVQDPRPPWWWNDAMENPSFVFENGDNWVTEDGDQLTYENNTSTDV